MTTMSHRYRVTFSLLVCVLVGRALLAETNVQKFSLEGWWRTAGVGAGETLYLTNTPTGYAGKGYHWGCISRHSTDFFVSCTESNSIITMRRKYWKRSDSPPDGVLTQLFTRGVQDSKPVLIDPESKAVLLIKP